MKKLILAEKPSVAKNIADATGAVRKNGYFEGELYVITWAFGHLLQLYDAKDYDPEMKSWQMDRAVRALALAARKRRWRTISPTAIPASAS